MTTSELTVAVHPETLRAAQDLAQRTGIDHLELINEACESLLRSIGLSFATFCSSWYPDCSDDIDPAARPAWEDDERRLAEEPEASEAVALAVDRRTVDVVVWIRQYVRWSPSTVVAEAVERTRRFVDGPRR